MKYLAAASLVVVVVVVAVVKEEYQIQVFSQNQIN